MVNQTISNYILGIKKVEEEKEKVVEEKVKPKKVVDKAYCKWFMKNIKKELSKMSEFEDYEDLKYTDGYTEDEAFEEFFCDYDIKLVPERNNMVVGFYSTNNYRTKWEMLESLEIEANNIHQQNWWEGILDEDDFCDLEAGDDPEYLEIMSVATFIEHLSWKCCEILWPNMQKEDY